MFTVDDEKLCAVQDCLDQVARQCMKTIGRSGLSDQLNSHLAKFLYGCMNQRLTIVRRVRERGPREFDKVLKFAAQALQILQQADVELQTRADSTPTT
ncbi:MAG TPA: hypothetical protein VK137_11840 [Planctomycetaceae bacterium]|nr:hypothetical protein [Planctomycetaceae bacterium]